MLDSPTNLGDDRGMRSAARDTTNIRDNSTSPVALRLCVDRVVPWELRLHAMLGAREGALREPRAAGAAGRVPVPRIALIATRNWWQKGRLGIQFLDGSRTQRARVKAVARLWLKVVNLAFNWDAGADAEIRISFQADRHSWSAVGTDCLNKKCYRRDEPTMNLGWLRDETSDIEYRRIVLHEFGHALGAVHEHQNPDGGIEWNEAAVLTAFRGPPNYWDDDAIRLNILTRYRIDSANGTEFDPKSIMCYAFPPSLIKGPPELARRGTAANSRLSAKDRRFMAHRYPRPPRE